MGRRRPSGDRCKDGAAPDVPSPGPRVLKAYVSRSPVPLGGRSRPGLKVPTARSQAVRGHGNVSPAATSVLLARPPGGRNGDSLTCQGASLQLLENSDSHTQLAARPPPDAVVVGGLAAPGRLPGRRAAWAAG